MSLGNDLKTKVTRLAKDIGKGAADAVDFAKYKLQLTDVRDEINTRYTEVGRMVVENGEGADAAQMQKLIAEIGDLKKRVEEINQALAALKRTVTCASCGKEIDADVAYCQFCGAKNEQKQE